MGGVFVNYRTGDGEFAATLVTRVLSARFGAGHVFLASRSIRPGDDFAGTILARLAECDVLLAVIGSRWHTVTERQRRRETHGPDDWVHREIAAAFALGLRVIPVFLDHAAPLTEAELPADVAPLARCQFLRLSHRNDTRDLARLMDELGDLVPDLLLTRVFTGAPSPSRTAAPVTWLRPDHGIVPFAGRDRELADLDRWLDTAKPVSACLVAGPAGHGKTRLARQLCQDMAGRGWLAGIVHANVTIADLTALGTVDSPLLVVVDDAETRFEELHAVAAALTERPVTAPPARLLLLSRQTGEWLTRLRTDTADRVSGLFRAVGEHELTPLAPTVAARRGEFLRAAAAYRDFLDLPDTGHSPPDDLAHPRFATTRTIHAAALVAVLADRDGHAESVPTPDPELHRAARPECPYRGLRPFEEQDARFFRGRDAQQRQLRKLLDQHTLVMVTGASGSGKSSLVRAGLLPSLREQDVAVSVLRPTVGSEPYALLANAVGPIVGTALTAHPAARDIPRLAGAIADAVGHWVLFVDQFEEFHAADTESAEELLDVLVRLLRAAPPRPAGTPALRAVLTGLSADILTTVAGPAHTVALPRMGPAELHAVITGPSDLPLVTVEPGLVARIVADTANAPGQLPIVELTLTRLWESQQGGTLTHRAYDEQGGVAGALASYAHDLCVRWPPDEQAVAERLLVQLVRPGEHGAVTLTHVPLDQLDTAARDMARTLAGHHLVVLQAEPGESGTVALAHEALARQWPQLRAWLTAVQDFRSWQERLRHQLQQWQQSGHDSGTLLHGAPLTTAEHWRTEHPGRLTAGEREYITASRRHQRRGLRRWRVVTALIGVLALAATVSAVVAVDRNQELAGQLRGAAAAALAVESQRRDGTDPLTALQFAQAAWRQDPAGPEAYASLLRQHLEYADADEIRSGLWSGSVGSVATTEDGRVTAVAERDGRVTVWTDLFGAAPRSWFVATVPDLLEVLVSPDGRWLAAVTGAGEIRLWDIGGRGAPAMLRPPAGPTEFAEPDTVASAVFSADSEFLVVTLLAGAPARAAGASNLVEVWDVPRDDRVGGFTTGAPVTDLSVLRAEDGGSAWFGEQRQDGSRHTVRRDLTTGAVLATAPAGYLTPAGRSAGRPTDLSGRYALSGAGSREDSFQLLTLVDLDTGDTYSLRRPPPAFQPAADDLTRYNTEPVMVLPGTSGPPRVYAFGTGALVRFHAAGPASTAAPPGPGHVALAPDGHRLATLAEQGLVTHDITTGRQSNGGPNTTAAALRLAAPPRLTYSEDGEKLLAMGADGALVVLSAATLALERRISLGAPTRNVALDPGTRRTTIVPLADDEVATVLGGHVATWRAGTGEQLTGWLELRSGGPAQMRDFAQHATAIAVPQTVNELLVLSTSGAELWQLGTDVLVGSFQPRPGDQASAVASEFGPPLVALHYRGDGQLVLWHPDDDRHSGPVPMPGDLSPVGFTRDGRLVADAGDGSLRVWDPRAGVGVASIHTPGPPGVWSLRNDTVASATTNGPLSIDMTPQHWIDHLCDLNNRDYTAAERALLPSGVDPVPPCAKP